MPCRCGRRSAAREKEGGCVFLGPFFLVLSASVSSSSIPHSSSPRPPSLCSIVSYPRPTLLPSQLVILSSRIAGGRGEVSKPRPSREWVFLRTNLGRRRFACVYFVPQLKVSASATADLACRSTVSRGSTFASRLSSRQQRLRVSLYARPFSVDEPTTLRSAVGRLPRRLLHADPTSRVSRVAVRRDATSDPRSFPEASLLVHACRRGTLSSLRERRSPFPAALPVFWLLRFPLLSLLDRRFCLRCVAARCLRARPCSLLLLAYSTCLPPRTRDATAGRTLAGRQVSLL